MNDVIGSKDESKLEGFEGKLNVLKFAGVTTLAPLNSFSPSAPSREDFPNLNVRYSLPFQQTMQQQAKDTGGLSPLKLAKFIITSHEGATDVEIWEDLKELHIVRMDETQICRAFAQLVNTQPNAEDGPLETKPFQEGRGEETTRRNLFYLIKRHGEINQKAPSPDVLVPARPAQLYWHKSDQLGSHLTFWESDAGTFGVRRYSQGDAVFVPIG